MRTSGIQIFMVNKSLTPTDLAKLKKLLVSPVTMLDEPEK